MARKLFGIRGLDVETEMRGYYPRGGGMVTLRVEPMVPGATLTPAVLEDRGEVIRIHGLVFVAGNLPIDVAVKMRKTVLIRLRTEGYDCIATLEEDIKAEKLQNGIGTASGIILWAETSTGCIIAGSALGEKGTPTTQTAMNATQGLLDNLAHNGCVDEYLQDQIIIFMALAEGKSRVVTGPLTLHTHTAIHVAQELTE
ncbi:RNA 3'-terminal phosphate cyclase domain-containing protein, partial [Endogone sp. FLAS-F59071]